MKKYTIKLSAKQVLALFEMCQKTLEIIEDAPDADRNRLKIDASFGLVRMIELALEKPLEGKSLINEAKEELGEDLRPEYLPELGLPGNWRD